MPMSSAMKIRAFGFLGWAVTVPSHSIEQKTTLRKRRGNLVKIVMLGVIIEKKIEKRPATRSGSDPGNEQNKSDNDETNPEASDETDHVVLGRSLEFEVGIGEEFVLVEPFGIGVAFLDFGFVLFRNGIDRCFHFT